MKTNNKQKKPYISPQIVVSYIELDHSIAAGSVSVAPGGGSGNANPWISEEEVETNMVEWNYND